MALLKGYIPLFREILAVPGVFSGPVLMFGYQDIVGDGLPADFRYPGLKEALEARGMGPITTVDIFDERADWQYDLNMPIPPERTEQYQTVIDIGCMEHLFDTATCFKNCISMVGVGGYYVLETPVYGCMAHGFHTFNPAMITETLRLNGFVIVMKRFTSFFGVPLKRPTDARNSFMWVVAQKKERVTPFRVPQQDGWKVQPKLRLGIAKYPRFLHFCETITPPALMPVAIVIRDLINGFIA